MTRRGFTLLEVNLAIFIMAVGTLAMCALYALGFRESRQSVEDVAAAAYADAYLGPLVQGLSATNMTWTSWRKIGEKPSKSTTSQVADAIWPKNGWMAYVERPSRDGFSYRVADNPNGTANTVFDDVLSKVPETFKGSRPGIPGGYHYALVVTRRGTIVQLAFRIARRRESLMAQPVFVSEIRYQGDPEL